MRTLVEISWEDTEELKDGEPAVKKENYWLLHFGLRYEIVENMVVNYTVAIVQNCKSGQIEMFDPRQCRVIGTEIKEK